MGIFADYKSYKKYEPQYADWKKDKDLAEAQKLEYLKTNPIDEKTKNEEIQRGKALLRAIDVMDEYSQTRAENMEVATQQAVAMMSCFSSYVGMGLGFLSLLLPPVKKGLSKLAERFPKINSYKYFIPAGVGMLASMAVSMCLQSWAASKEVGASRKGRFEAMKNELSDVKNFAVLTEEQKAKQDQIVSKMKTTKDMKKGIAAKKSNLMNPFTFFDVLSEMTSNDYKFNKERKEFNSSLYKGADENKPLSKEDIEKAKKDQQLLHNIIEKVDMASQDYAENVELATGSITAIGMAGGLFTGWLANKLIKLFKVENVMAQKALPMGVGAVLAIGTAIWAASVQKQASRVGRYLAKKELEKDMNNFVYVDTDKTKDVKDAKVQKKQKPNFFKFMVQVFKDNAEYKKYMKTKGVETIKKQKALKDIEITPEQEKEAKRLQKNAFKAFNKLDEKSQQYAESVEAVGQVIGTPIALAGSLVGMGLGSIPMLKAKKAGTFLKTPMWKFIVPMYAGAFLGTIPAILNNIYFTKQQKQASRVAHMLALNEMKDYKNYVDYENLTPEKKVQAGEVKSVEADQKSTSLLSNFKKQ